MTCTKILVTDTTFTPAPERDRERGLMGYLQVTLNNVVVLDGLTLRKSIEGSPYIAFPSKVRGGQRYPYVRPRGEEERKELQRQVFAALGLEGSGR